jgi:hypothetical protein
MDSAAPDLETIDLGSGVNRLRTRRAGLRYRRAAVALVLSLTVVATGGLLFVLMRPRHHRDASAGNQAAETSVSRSPTSAPTPPVRSNEPLLGRFYPPLDGNYTTTIVLPTGLTVTLAGDVTKTIAGLGATFFGTVTPKNPAACCALSFGIEHAAPSDLFATLGPNAIAAPLLVSAAHAVQPDLNQVAGRFGILSTGDWTLTASFENGDHTAVADAIVLKLLDSWHLRSTPNGAVVQVPTTLTIDTSEADFGTTPENLTDKQFNLVETRCSPNGSKPTIVKQGTDVTGYWCEHGLLVRSEGSLSYVDRVVADLKVNVEPKA